MTTSPLTRTMALRFETWALCETGREADRHGLIAANLGEAIEAATPPMMLAKYVSRGGFPSFVILETNDAAREGEARQIAHFYNVKVKREWRSVGQVAIPRAAHAGSLPMNSFEPRRPFRAGIDDALSGRQPGEGHLITIAGEPAWTA